MFLVHLQEVVDDGHMLSELLVLVHILGLDLLETPSKVLSRLSQVRVFVNCSRGLREAAVLEARLQPSR